ncbi:hypothetical protein [Nocardiopsis sp. LOL_012]|uniref:hypothetical protein n=1 Tax=Nocardiopsis sp. LOL_012 TaxID=3345409 RepID=UPI003A8377A7
MTRSLTLAAAAAVGLALVPFPALAAGVDDGGTGGLDYPRGGEGPEGSETAFTLQDTRIAESSGLAPSLRHEGVWWTHNDSGVDVAPALYAVNGAGETLATVTLAVRIRDWEAVAVTEGADGAPTVLVGNIGDNYGGGWPGVTVHRFTEPEVLADTTVEPETLTFTYADGGRDAEAMMVDPRDGRLYVVSKEFAGGVYAAPEEIDPAATNVLERIDSAPLFVTDAAFHPDGTRYVLRTYWGVTVYDSTDGVPGTSMGSFELPESDQGEAIAFTPDGTALMAGTEGVNAPVWRVPLPEEYRSGQAPETAAETGQAEEEQAGGADAGSGGALRSIVAGAVLAVLAIGGIVLLARKG